MEKENKTIIRALNKYGRIPENWELLNQIEQLELELSGYREAILKNDKMLGLQQENEKLKLNHKQLKDIEKLATSNSRLMQENKQLKENRNKLKKWLDKIVKLTENIIRELQEKITLLNKMNEDNYNKYCNELKKNNKAIEFISEYRNGINNWFEFTINDKIKLLDILKGEENDNNI